MHQKLEKLSLFESATLRLTGWYVLLLMTLSILFSVVLYQIGTSEFNHALAPVHPGEVELFYPGDGTTPLRLQRIGESTNRLVVSLVVFNITVLVGGTIVSYLLARRTLQPIKEAHEAQSRFASDAAHELRTPLAVMQTELEVNLRDKKATARTLRPILASSLEEVSRLRTLTNRLLLLASQQEPVIGLVELEPVVVDAVTHIIPLAQQRQITIDNQVGPSRAKGNAESIADVLGILLDNAIKYSPKRSKVFVTSSETAHDIQLHVRDEGPGIPKLEQGKIFERFYRVDVSRSKDDVAGHGLGLSLARRMVEEMNGKITVRSDGQSGATFTVSLPK